MSVVAPPPMLQQQGEFDVLLALYRAEQPRRVLEVGVHLGGTLYHWLRESTGGVTVVAIDDRHQAREQYDAWTPEGVELVTITGDSATMPVIEQAAEHGPFDWVFIDADHHELHVRADWMNYGQRLAAAGSIVALHDILPSHDPTIQVDLLWREIQRDHVTRTIALEGGLGIGVVYTQATAVG